MRKQEAAACIKAAVGCAGLNFNRVTEREFYAAHYNSRNRVCPASTGFDGYTNLQIKLVGRGEIRTVSKANKTVRALRRLESRRDTRLDKAAF